MNCFMTSLPKHYYSAINYSSNILSHFLKEAGKGDRITMQLQTIIAFKYRIRNIYREGEETEYSDILPELPAQYISHTPSFVELIYRSYPRLLNLRELAKGPPDPKKQEQRASTAAP